MRSTQKISGICILIICFLFTACFGEDNTNQETSGENQAANSTNENKNVSSDDPLKLARLINLPYTPEESDFREINLSTKGKEKSVPSPNDRKLIAVLKFSAEDISEIIQSAEKLKPSTPAEIDAESWFPVELVALSQISGDETLKGNSYAANDFLKTPYTGGKLTRISNTDYFVLELTAL